MERYEAYKDSGVEWIGEIPEGWEARRIKRIASCTRGMGIQRGDVVDVGRPCVRYGELYTTYCNRIEEPVSHITDELWDASVIVRPNDLIMALTGETKEDIGPTCVNVSKEGFAASGDTLVIRPREHDGRFLAYAMNSNYVASQKTLDANGEIIVHLGADKVANEVVVLPSGGEERAIADYLDAKTAEIDGLVADCEREVELLQEYRKAVISEAVTKGLDPNVPMKDSGVEWIGRIPEGWSILYPKKLFALRKERAYPNDVQLTASQKKGIVTQNEYMRLENQRVVQVITGNDILKHVEAGDFVISMRSFQGGLEYSTICGKISSAYVMLYAIDRSFICDEYYKYLFKSDEYIQALQSTSNLVRDGQALRFSNFVQVYLPVPSVTEQQRIAQYLSIKTAEIDSLIEMKQQMADKLREYRKSLIFEAVTGKFKVPGVD